MTKTPDSEPWRGLPAEVADLIEPELDATTDAILVAIAIWGAAIVVFGLSKVLWLSLLILAIAGMGDMVSGIFRATILQTAVEDRYRGRLEGIGMAVWATGPSIGNVESGDMARC